MVDILVEVEPYFLYFLSESVTLTLQPNTYNSQDSLVDIHLTIVAAELDSLNCLTPMHFLFSLHYQRLRRTNKSYRGHHCCGKPCWFSARIRKMQ